MKAGSNGFMLFLLAVNLSIFKELSIYKKV
jgi:hypothetical protein